jgi:DNA-binding response OmpR family regulator
MTAPPASKVILVEDDASMQAVLRTLLEIEGFQVVTAPILQNQQELVRFIMDEKSDVILLDVYLRDSSGIDLLRELRKDRDFAATRVIMTSGMAVKERCLAAGADGFLLKPFMPDELIEKLRG